MLKRSGIGTPPEDRVIVVPGSNLAALGFTRSLGEEGVNVTALAERPGPGLYSKYCAAVVCKGLDDPSVFADTIVRIAGRSPRRATLLPASDEAARMISLGKARLESYVNVPVSSPGSMHLCLSKIGVHRMAEKLGVQHPAAYFPDGMEEISKVASSIDYPCTLKPDDSKTFYSLLGVKALVVRSKEELIRCYAVTVKLGLSVFVQEYIPGGRDSNFGFAAYFDKERTPHCTVTYRRLQEWPLDTPGIAAMAVTEAAPDLVEEATRFFKGLEFRGVAQAEFKKDERDGSFKILDVNPRAWMSNRLAARSGCNIPFAAYLDSIGIPPEESVMRQGVKWVNVGDALFSTLGLWRRHQVSFSEWLPLLRGEIVAADYDKNDMKPFSWILRHGGWASRFAEVWRIQTAKIDGARSRQLALLRDQEPPKIL